MILSSSASSQHLPPNSEFSSVIGASSLTHEELLDVAVLLRFRAPSVTAVHTGVQGLRRHLISSSQALFKSSLQSLFGCSAGHDALPNLLRTNPRSASLQDISATSITSFLALHVEDALQVSRRRHPGAATATTHQFSYASTSTSARGPWGSRQTSLQGPGTPISSWSPSQCPGRSTPHTVITMDTAIVTTADAGSYA